RAGGGNGTTAAAAPPQPTSASSASACGDTGAVWDIGEEPSFRSPSPHRTCELRAHQNGLGAPPAAAASTVLPSNAASAGGAAATSSGASSVQHSAAAVVAVAQRQQRAMRQHVQRQFSPSPGRRAVLVPGPLLTEKPVVVLRSSVSPLPHHRPRAMSLEVGNWQNDVVLAAQARIRRLEEQVVSLSAQISELQASHADLEFQLEEEQQQGRAAVAAATAAAAKRSGGGGGNGKGGGPVPSHGVESADARAQEREQQLQEQVRQLQDRLKARETELEEQVTRARGANEGLAKQNRALYGTLEETLSAAEHAAQELKQLRASHAQLQEAHDAAQKEVSQLKEDLDLRERALSAVQTEFSALRRRHEELTAAAEAARRDSALRDGRLRRELDAATQDAGTLAAQLTKLQREHQQLHSRKAEKDRQLAALAKRADAQQEQLSGAERLAQEQAALVRELESRATLLRNRNTALDRAVAAEKEARQAAQEQVRQMEEEIALLVSIVRQSDPNLEALTRYKRDPSPTCGEGEEDVAEAEGGQVTDGRGCYPGAAAVPPQQLPCNSRGSSSRRQQDPYWHSVVTITAESGPGAGTRSSTQLPLQFPIPGAMALSVRAPPPGSPQVSRHRHVDTEGTVTAPFGEVSAPSAAAAVAAILQPSPRGLSAGESPRGEPDPGSARGGNLRQASSPDGSPLAMLYPAKHNMTGGVFLELSASRGARSTSPRAVASPSAIDKAPSIGGAANGHECGSGSSPRMAQEARLAANSAGGAGGNGLRRTRTPPCIRASSAGMRGGRRSEVYGPGHLGTTWGGAESVGGGKTIGPVWRGAGVARRSATPPGTSAVRRGRDNQALVGPPVGVKSNSAGSGIGHGVTASSIAAAVLSGEPDGGGDVPQAALVESVVDVSMGDRVLWAKPRRGCRSAIGAADGGRVGGCSAPAGGADQRVGSQMQMLGLGAMQVAQRELAGPAAAAAGGHNRRRSCSAVEWVRLRAASHTHSNRRRARTPEPRTAAAWLKLTVEEEEEELTAVASGGSRKRHPIPHSEISSTGRGSYKLGPPPLAVDAAAATVTVVQEGPFSDSAAELAVLLQQQQQLGPRVRDGRRAAAVQGVSVVASHSEGPGAELGEGNQFTGSAGPAKRSRISGGCSDVASADGGSVCGDTNLRCSGDAGDAGGGWSAGLDDDIKAEMGSPVKLQPARGVQQVNGHGMLEGGGPAVNDSPGKSHVLRTSAEGGGDGGGGRDDASLSPCRADARGVGRAAIDRASSIIRASYAIDSPLHRQQQQRWQQQQQQRQQGLQQSAGEARLGSPVAAMTGNTIAGDEDELDPLGAVLRSLQKRQAALLKELAGGGAGDSPSLIVRSPLRSTGTSPRHLQLLNRSPPAVDSPTLASFTFANPNPALLLMVACSDPQPSGELGSFTGSDGGTGNSGATNLETAAQAARPPCRRSMSFPKEGLSKDEERTEVPPGNGGAGDGTTATASQSPLRSSTCPKAHTTPKMKRHPTPPPPPPPPPPRSPHRPSVTAAAAAAVAAGAGVGGPLTALLDQLEHAGNKWRSGAAAVAAAAEVGGLAASLRLSIGSSDGAMSQSPAPPSLPSTQQYPQQVVTHFSVASALKATAELQRRAECSAVPNDHLAAVAFLTEVGRSGGDKDETDVGSEASTDASGGDWTATEGGGDVQLQKDSGGNERTKVAEVSPPKLRQLAEAQLTATSATGTMDTADFGGNNAAVPSPPQPRDERSIGGSELYPDEDYPGAFDCDAGHLVARLGVSLYDNIAYDLSRTTSARADYDTSVGGVPPQLTGRSSPSGPIVAMSISPAQIAACGGANGEGADAAATESTATSGLRSNPAILRPFPAANATREFKVLGGSQMELESHFNSSASVAATISGAASALMSASSHAVSSMLETSFRGSRQALLGLEEAVWKRLEEGEDEDEDEEANQCSPLGAVSDCVDAGAVAAMAAEEEGSAAYEGDDVPTSASGNDLQMGKSAAAELGSADQSPWRLHPGGDDAGDGNSNGAVSVSSIAALPGTDAGGMAPVTDSQEARHREAVAAEEAAQVEVRPIADGEAVASSEDLTTVPATPPQAASMAQGTGVTSSSVSLPLSASSQTHTAAVAGAGGSAPYPRLAGSSGPVLGSWWLGRAEPTLLDRQFQQHMSLLSISRTSFGHAAAVAASSVSSASASSSASGATSGPSSSGHDWLQQRRPPSPSVKPLSLAEVLRRPPSNSAR
ncbi:hypothetical protein VaNZ11_015488, partial [Volvox africanus]